MSFDKKLYDQIMSQPEGLPHPLYRKALAKYVRELSDEVKSAVEAARYEIYDMELEWRELNERVLLRLGFTPEEARMLRDKRLDSPGMRRVITKCGVREFLRRRMKERKR